MRSAIRTWDAVTPISRSTILNSFSPALVGDLLDVMSVHVYPTTADTAADLAAVAARKVPGKPTVATEFFPGTCLGSCFEAFLDATRGTVVGWLGHTSGVTMRERALLWQPLHPDWTTTFRRMTPAVSPCSMC